MGAQTFVGPDTGAKAVLLYELFPGQVEVGALVRIVEEMSERFDEEMTALPGKGDADVVAVCEVRLPAAQTDMISPSLRKASPI